MPTVEEAVQNRTGILIEWESKKPLRILETEEPHMYAFGQPEYDNKEIGKGSAYNLIGSLGSDFLIDSFKRSSLANPSLVESSFKEKAIIL